jgi:RNA polymerase sigma-70 factor (ECF subfamily)
VTEPSGKPAGMTDPDSQDIIRRSKAGDQAAFALLVRGHYPVAYALALRILCNEMEAEDVAQEAFVRVWRHLDRFDPETRFTTWLYRIVTNLSLDQIRSRRRKGGRVLNRREDDEAPEPVEASTPETIASNRDFVRIVNRLAGDLPETQRVVFTLRDIQDLPIETVCAITGLSSESIRTNLHYARRRIRESLEKDYSVKGSAL